MKPSACQHESDLRQALCAGVIPEALRSHVEQCADCAAAFQLAQALNLQARHAMAAAAPPDPHWILMRARRQGRELAARRVSLLLTGMRLLAAGYVVAVAAWLLRSFAAQQFRQVLSVLPANTAWQSALGAMVAAGLVLAGLLPMLRLSSRR